MAVIYADCARCGSPMFGRGRALSTGRRVCAKCYEHVVFALKVKDDDVTVPWEETRAHRRFLAKQRKSAHPKGYFEKEEIEA